MNATGSSKLYYETASLCMDSVLQHKKEESVSSDSPTKSYPFGGRVSEAGGACEVGECVTRGSGVRGGE